MIKLKIISIIIIMAMLSCTTLFFFKVYKIAIIVFILGILMLPIWYRLLGETLISHAILKNGYKMDYNQIIKIFGIRAEKVLKRMADKNVIELSETTVILKEGSKGH